MSPGSINGAGHDDFAVDRLYCEAALRRISEAAPRKQAWRMSEKAFTAAIDERIAAGAFNDPNKAMKWITGRALLYYELMCPEEWWDISRRSYTVNPKSFFASCKYLESSVDLWRQPCEQSVINVQRQELRDEERVWELAASVQASVQASGAKPRLHVDLTRLSDVSPSCITWFWEPYIPLGMITLLDGDPSVGKSYVGLSLAAEFSRGKLLDGREVPPGNTLYLSSENPAAEVTRPRFDALGGDVGRLFLLRGVCMPGEDGADMRRGITLADMEALDEAICETSAQLMIVDPIQSYFGINVDLHRANETRPIMDGLARLAAEHSCAILLIRHLSKQTGGSAIKRGLGSIDLSGAARSVLLAGSLPDDPDTRALAHIKTNVGRVGRSLGYAIDDEGRFMWTGNSDITPAQLLAAPTGSGDRKLAEATQWLAEVLHSGDQKVGEVRGLAEGAGISRITLRRAKEALKVRHYKTPGMDGDWVWSLRDGAQTENMINIGEIEQVRCCSSTMKLTSVSPLDSDLAQTNCVSTLENNLENRADAKKGNGSDRNRRSLI